MKRYRGRRLNQAGQGTIEYLLILIIAVILILSLLYQFNSAFRAYAEVFFDGYIACLLETGELPGGQGQCAAEMPNFDLANGKRHLKENLPEPGDNPSTPESAPDKNDRKRSEVVSSGSSGGRSASTPVGGGFGRRSGRNASTPVNSNGSEGSEGEEEAGTADMMGRSSSSVVARSGRDPEGREAIGTEFSSSVEERRENEKERPKSVKAAENESGNNLRGANTREKEPSQLRKPASPPDEEGFTFGGLIRMVLIAALIIIILVFLGGQLLQFSKSREKGGD